MHICMIAGVFPPDTGGVSRHVFVLSKKLSERGHQVTVITRGSRERTLSEQIDNIRVYRVRFIPCYPFHLQFHGFFMNQLGKSLASDLDLIHLHNPAIPIIHTSLPMVVTQHATAKSYIEHLESRDVYSLGLKLFKTMYVSIDRKILKSADKIIATSYSCAKELREYYGIERAEVIHSAVDTNLFIPGENRLNRTPYILYVGHLSTLKGVLDLVKSASYVCHQWPDIKFILIGSGPFEARLRTAVRRLGLEANFSFVGDVADKSRMVEYYQNATVHVLPSYSEGGMPLAVLEAMSCGLPTVATNVGGIPEAVVNGQTGLLVPPKDPESLAKAILKLLNDAQLRKRMGENARKRAEEHYDWDVVAGETEKIYHSILLKHDTE